MIYHMTVSKPTFFADQSEFRKWLDKNHRMEKELIVGFYKKDSGKPSMTWPESVDQALCFGWIDGVRKSIDQESYQIRFTPRKPTSIWSAVNIAKVEKLTKEGLMQPAGIAAFKLRKEEKSKVYSFENDAKQLDTEMESKFEADSTAWQYFKAQAPSYQKAVIHWIMTAKQESTRLSRLQKTIAQSHLGKRLE